MSGCEHEEFDASVRVVRLEDTGRFHAEVRITCQQCGTAMQFLGLPVGLNLAGASIDADGQEARLAIAPAGEVPHPLEGVSGFRVPATPRGLG